MSNYNKYESALEQLKASMEATVLGSGDMSAIKRMNKPISSLRHTYEFDSGFKSAIESLNGSVLTQTMGFNSKSLVSQIVSMQRAIGLFVPAHGFDSEFKSVMASLGEPYGESIASKQAEMFKTINEIGYLSGMEKISKVYGQSIVSKQAEILKTINGRDYLSSMEKISKTMASLSELYWQRSNRYLIEKLQNIDISEVIQIHNELNNSLKPYDSYDDLSSSNISWLSLDEVRRILMEIITLYMFVMFFVNPALERIDLEKSNLKQQNWFKEEFKQQTNLFVPKKKELYYVTLRDNIVLRSNPYIKQSTAKAHLDKNVKLLFLLRKDNWLNVEYFDEKNEITQVGWVHIKNLRRVRTY